ncbi:hypothetical protein [Flavobacterium sp.]|jgi:hypothetical protein|uniref:hypothetical protein n=1 Tax=Flavobacterium sp. TaxID=239 RepID=UPI0037BFEC5D
MKTLKYYLSPLTQFFKSANKKSMKTGINSDDFEFTYPKLGINLNQDPENKKSQKSLLSLMYSDENQTLFI